MKILKLDCYIGEAMVVIAVYDIRAAGRQNWAPNSTALKSTRGIRESPSGLPRRDGVNLFERYDYQART